MKECIRMYYLIPALFGAMAVFYLYYQSFKHRPGSSLTKRILVKCAATLMAALVCLLGAIQNPIPANWIMLAGLVACMAADGVLCVHFVAGAACFGLGHVLYLIAFSMMNLPTWGSLILFVCMMACITHLCRRWKKRMGKRAPVFLAYGVLLCLMTSVSVSQRPLFFAGGLLFAISDGLLAYQLFDRRSIKIDYVSLALYYLGQFLMGFAVFTG